MTQNVKQSRTRAKSKKSNLRLPPDLHVDLYRTMRRIRAFDEKVAELFEGGEIKGTAHSYVGQEAVAAGVCASLGPEDFMASHHRGHGHCIAKGARLDLMMAELMGRESGYCNGLGGSMHIADLGLNILGANGIVGAARPLSTGAGLAARLEGSGRVAVAFFGDGASNQGVFHESLNLASVWKLPIVFVCENNQYALSTSYRDTTSVDQVAERASAYGIPGRTIDGNDVVEVYEAVREAVERARAGEGPTLIEAMTYRWGGHSMRANIRDPRSEDEYAGWMERDPVQRAERELKEVEIADEAGIEGIGAEVVSELDEAVEFGRAAAQPEPDVLRAAVYAPHEAFEEPGLANGNGRALGFVEALNEAMHQEMESDPRVIVMGEDVGATGGIFGATKGLFDKYGKDRVRDTPISEAGFVGCGIGAAIAGLRPVVEIQIFDFVALTMDMLVNQAAKFRFMLGGKNTVPVVIRGPQGGGIRLAAQHSQSLEAWFTPRAGPRGGGAIEPLRGEGAPHRGHPRLQPGHLPRGQAPVPRAPGPGAGGALRDPPREGRGQARGYGRDGGGDDGHGPAGARGGGEPRAPGAQRGSHRPADPEAPRRGHPLRVDPQDPSARHRPRGVPDGRVRSGGRGGRGGEGLRLARRPGRPGGRPRYPDALQRGTGAPGDPEPAAHRRRDSRDPRLLT